MRRRPFIVVLIEILVEGLIHPFGFVRISDWRKDWWQPLLLILVWPLFAMCTIIVLISIILCNRPVYEIVQTVKPYIPRKRYRPPPPPSLPPAGSFRCRIANGGNGPQRLEGRPRALTLELSSDEELKGGVQVKAVQYGEGDCQAQAGHRTDGQQQNQGNSHESKQNEEQRTYLQHQSTLFRKVPPELRLLIYRAVLLPPEGTELRIDRTRGRLCSYTRSHYMEDLPSVANYDDEESEGNSQDHKNCKPNRSAGLLCSCRQIYMEAMNVLYRETPFNIPNSIILEDLHKTTIAHRFRSIRSLHLDTESFDRSTFTSLASYEYPTWSIAWLMIGFMTGLRRLRVTIWWQPTQDELLGLLQPMLNFKIPDFVVRLTWPIDSKEVIRRLGGKVPFRIVVREVV